MNFQKHIELFQAIQSGSLDKVKSILEELDNQFEQNILCRVIRYLKSFVEVEHTLDSPCGDGRYKEFAGFTPLEFARRLKHDSITDLLSHWHEQSTADDTLKDEQKLLLGDMQVDWEMVG